MDAGRRPSSCPGRGRAGDPGAPATSPEALADGLAAHVADVAGGCPGAQLVLQLDEPACPPSWPDASRPRAALGAAALEEHRARAAQAVLGARPRPAPWRACTAAPPAPPSVFCRRPVPVLSFDVTLLPASDSTPSARRVEAGVRLVAGVLTRPT